MMMLSNHSKYVRKKTLVVLISSAILGVGLLKIICSIITNAQVVKTLLVINISEINMKLFLFVIKYNK